MALSVPARRNHYEDPAVRARLAEFFGGEVPDRATAAFFAAGTDEASRHRERLPLEELQTALQRGSEINRSLWDRRSLVAQLDVEYVNFDEPAAPYLNPERTVQLQEPVVESLGRFLSSFGIVPLHLMTGRGHHFLWRMEEASGAFRRLAEFGHLGASIQRLYATEQSPTGDTVPPAFRSAWAGLGLVVEWMAQQVQALARERCEVPVEMAAIEAGGGERAREIVAIDITEYSDPLCSRVTRAPFSIYLKPEQQRGAIGAELARELPPLFIVPVGGMPWPQALCVMRDPEAVRELAQTASAEIPETAAGMERLIAAYEGSPLARFHQHYYSQQHDAPSAWPETYDLTPLESLPPCARHMVEQPNDLLLRPGCVRRVVRVMLALGWHPRHIAGLIRSKYERDFGWGDQWQGCDPATRADFYSRIFAGQVFTGGDRLEDFDCQSARNERLCMVEDCREDLLPYRTSLLERRNHERLASGPFNRLFLPAEHL